MGRECDLALAERFLEDACERQAVLRLDGDPGIGKTTIWLEVIRRAGARGFRVLSCRPAETEAKLGLSALADLLEPVSADALEALPDPQRHALEVALLRVAPGPGTRDRRTIATAVRSLFAALSQDRPLLVAVDDVQWLDATSATVLEFALRRLGDRRVGWLCARRRTELARLAGDAAVPPEALVRHTVGPLGPTALDHLLRERLREPLARSGVARVHEMSGGNPLFALEIAHDLQAYPDVGPMAPRRVPESLREILASRIPALRGGAREALLVAAALAHPTSRLVRRSASAASLEEAEASGLIEMDGESIVFVHPLYASAVYESAPPAQRRAVHRSLARLVDDPEEQARHLALAASGADEPVASRLEQVAAHARARGAWDSAAELLERACALTPADHDDAMQRRALAAAEHHIHAGKRRQARALLERRLAGRLPSPRRADALRLLAQIAYNDENFPEAGRLFAEALDHPSDARVAVASELGVAYVRSNAWDFPGGATHAYRALDRAERTGDGALIGQALAYCAMFDFLCGRGLAWDKVERSLALEDPDSLMPVGWRPSTIAALLHLYAGRLSEARERLTAVWRVAAARGQESDLAFVVLWLSWLETLSGSFTSAATLAEEAASLAALTGAASMHAWVLTQQAFVEAHRGDADETRRLCAAAAPLVARSGNALPSIWIAASLARLELSLGDAQAAWQACEPLTEALERRGVGEPVPAFFLGEAIEALIELGRIDRAQALLDELEQRARDLDRAWAVAIAGRCRALLLAARGELDGAADALLRAQVEHERLEMPFELGRTLLAKGVVLRRRRKRAEAKRSFEQALEIFARTGARLWAERTHRELGRLGLRRSSDGRITASEQRVAELAARGLTNRQVAAALSISPKTVEANLARVYRKLGIRSRAQLGARFAGAVPAGDPAHEFT